MSFPTGEILITGLGRDREARRYWYPDTIHFGEVGAFASEEFLMSAAPSARPFPKV